MEGLRSGLEVSANSGAGDFRREWEEFKQKRKQQQLDQSINYTGACVLNMNAEHLAGGVPPRMTACSMVSSVDAPLTHKDVVTLGGQMIHKGRAGGGAFVCGYQREFSPRSSLHVQASTGLRSLLSLTSTRQISEHSTASLTGTWSAAEGTGMELSVSRQITESVSGDFGWVLGPGGAEGMSLSLRREGEKSRVSGTVHVGSVTGLTGSYVRQLSKKSGMRAAVKLGTMGLEGELGATRRAGDYGNVGLSVSVGIHGVVAKLRFTRGGQKFVFPCLVYGHFEWRVALASALLPPLGIALLKRYAIKPLLLRHERREAQSLRAASTQLIRRGLSSAASEQRLLEPVAARKLRQEVGKGGLVVVDAVYGTRAAIDARSSLHTPPAPPAAAENGEQSSTTDGGSAGSTAGTAAGTAAAAADAAEEEEEEGGGRCLDVTPALRFLVSDSRLVLYQGISKVGLMGFCDVAPGEAKELQVRYLLDGAPHSISVGDLQGCQLPSGGTAIGDEEERGKILRHAAANGLLKTAGDDEKPGP